MLDLLLGSQTAHRILLHLFHYGETYPSAVSKDFGLSLGQVQRQFDRLENAGLLISKLSGRTRVYRFNPKSAYAKPFQALVKIDYDSIPLGEKTKLFAERRRPRRRGKPVIPA